MFVAQIGIFGLLDKEAFDGQKAVFAFNYNDSTYLLPDYFNTWPWLAQIYRCYGTFGLLEASSEKFENWGKKF